MLTVSPPHTATSHQADLKYRPDIDGLRAIAVLAVVGYHAFPNWIGGGFIGVDVFFVISGFLISSIIFGSLRNGTFSFGEFYSRRVRRIFPALLVVLLACFAFGWFALLSDEYMQLGKHMAGAAGFMSNFVLWKESAYFDNVAETKPLLHLWSLGIEEQFYLIWPFVLWVAWKLRIHLLAVLSVIAGASFAINITLIQTDATAVFYSPQTRFWELLIGSALAYNSVFKRGATGDLGDTAATWRRNVQSIIGACAIALGVVLVTRASQFPGWWALLPTVGAFLIISAGPSAWFNRRVLANKVMVWIGLISFPLYLWHWPLLSFNRIIQSAWPRPARAAVAVLLAFILAWLTYRIIEKPIRFGKRRGQMVFAMLTIMLATGFVGYNAYKREGLAFRPAIRELERNRNELVRTPVMDDACKKFVGISAPLFPYCRFHDAHGKTTVAILGDSHGHVAFPGIAELLEKHHINTLLMANSSCPPLLGAESGTNDVDKLACKQKIEQMYAILSAKPEIHKVFFISRGPVYLTGNGFGEPEKAMTGPPIVPADVFEAGVHKTVAELTKLGKQVYFVLENPELGIDPSACILRPFRRKTMICAVNADIVNKRQKSYLEIFARLHEAPVIRVMDAFCPAGSCQAIRNGELLYADDDHLSVAGSRFQANEILKPWLLE